MESEVVFKLWPDSAVFVVNASCDIEDVAAVSPDAWVGDNGVVGHALSLDGLLPGGEEIESWVDVGWKAVGKKSLFAKVDFVAFVEVDLKKVEDTPLDVG